MGTRGGHRRRQWRVRHKANEIRGQVAERADDHELLIAKEGGLFTLH